MNKMGSLSDERKGMGRRVCKHTDTTRSDVGGNHDRRFAGLELVENPVTLGLLFVAVDG